MYQLTVLTGTAKYSIPFEGTPTVQQVLKQAGIVLPHPCGGIGTCGKCAIEIIGSISQPEEAERLAGSRLSCRTRLYGNAIVTLKNTSPLHAEGFQTSIAPGADTGKKIGCAADIGTTTIALSVYDLSTGSCLAAATGRNPQAVFSADVMGRIDAALNGSLATMQARITSCLQTLADETGYLDQIDYWCITGNTTMLYLLTGRSPDSLAYAPYTADHLFGEEITFLGKPAYLPSCMHAFVGADITCAALASGMCDTAETSLLCDIGTNGEIILWKNKTFYVTSTAAGPVFEGAGISCGCQSIPGAIEAVSLQQGGLSVKTIDNVKPVGLCGSGVIDAVACLLENGILDETGAMEEDAVALCEGISLTREDIRNVQLAKGAIAAGIRTLLEATSTSEEEISVFYLAGGFGKHLHPDSAVRIGLFPASLKNKIKILGNAALQGAAAMLTEDAAKNTAQTFAQKSSYVSLPDYPTFGKNYIEELSF